MKVTSTLAVLPPLMEWLGALAVVGALLYGVTEVARGDVQAGDFIAFLIALLMMYGPVKKLSRVNAQFHQGMACAERVFEVLDTRSEIADSPSAVPLARPRRDIVFDHVSFTYPDAPANPVLRDVSFRVAAGQVAAIVGLSGAGKTTLVNLLPRLYDVGAGAVRIDGVDVRDVSLASLRAHIGIVTQDTVLFDDTIARNIAYASQASHATGSPGAATPVAGTGHAGQADVAARIEAAARAAHAHEFVQELPDGYETRIGDRGLRLSGGQRQRLAIARALFRNAPILILDEATSSLDTESERLVQDALARLLLNRTSFVIAHRLSTVRRADLIVVLDEGEVREIGRHEELLATPGSLYARLYSLQLFDVGPPRDTGRGRRRRAPGSRGMITSMTGFASLTREDELATVGVTVRSVNHRYLDVQIRTPQALAGLESEMRSRVQRRVARGRVELTLTVAAKAPPAVDVAIDTALVAALADAAERPEVAQAARAGWTAGELLRFPQVVTLRERAGGPGGRAARRRGGSRRGGTTPWRRSSACGPGKGTCCAPTSTAGVRRWPTWSRGSPPKPPTGRPGCASGCRSASPSWRWRSGGARRRWRRRSCVGPRGPTSTRRLPGSAPTSRTGRRWPRRRSRADGSSTSCCRR